MSPVSQLRKAYVVETCLNLCPKDGSYMEKLEYVLSLLTENERNGNERNHKWKCQCIYIYKKVPCTQKVYSLI